MASVLLAAKMASVLLAAKMASVLLAAKMASVLLAAKMASVLLAANMASVLLDDGPDFATMTGVIAIRFIFFSSVLLPDAQYIHLWARLPWTIGFRLVHELFLLKPLKIWSTPAWLATII